ncbi:MAG: CPXCG motif-containing cysteine-rich protein [Pseudohongiellaceae bacterium]
MLNDLEECEVQCPYCGEGICVLVDCSVMEQQYIEDCQVCCAPIEFSVLIDEDENLHVSVSRDDE